VTYKDPPGRLPQEVNYDRALKQLGLSVDQCFKFLDTFSFGSQYEKMFSTWHTCQIRGSVIIFDSVKMMDVPTFRQWLTVNRFPYKNMFFNVRIPSGCSRMFWHINTYISIVVRYSALPSTDLFTFVVWIWLSYPRIPLILNSTLEASGCRRDYWFSTVSTMIILRMSHYFLFMTFQAKFIVVKYSFPAICTMVMCVFWLYLGFVGTIPASLGFRVYEDSTIKTTIIFLDNISGFYLFSTHILIITCLVSKCKAGHNDYLV